MVLALAAHDELTRPPVDVVELDGDHFWRTQAQACEQEEHRVIATTEARVGPDLREDHLDLLGRQMARQPGVIALGYARHAERQVGHRESALEQILEEAAQVGRRCLVPERRLAGGQPLEEGDGVAGRDRAKLDVGLAEAEAQEPVGEAPAMADRSFAQPSLTAQIVFVVPPQGRVGKLSCRWRRRRLGHTERHEISGEALDDEDAILKSVTTPVRSQHEFGRQA